MEIRQVRPKEKMKYRSSYTPQDMSDAYHMVKEQHLPVERVAKLYGIPITTLKSRVHGKVDVDVLKSGTASLFSLEQEAFLSQHLATMAEIGYGYSRQETINLASDYAVHLGLREKSKPLSKQWFYNFLDRWPCLKVKKPRALEVARARSATKAVVERYFEELHNILVKYDLQESPHRIFNIDEKGLSLQHKPPKIVTGIHYKTQAITAGKSNTVTVIGGGSAVGTQIPPFFIFPGMRMLPNLLDGSSPGAAGTVSESGWSNTEIFSTYMKEHFVKYLPPRSIDEKVLVLYDGHLSHVSLGLVEWAQENNIILFVLPPHCSHLLQPMDVSCYGPFEIAWNSACHHHLRESGGNVVTRFDVARIACKVYTASLSVSNIQSAFKRCGVYPFNPTVIDDSCVAPATAFPSGQQNVSIESSTCNHENNAPTNIHVAEATDARLFLEKRGGETLRNVRVAKVRKTLSKIVGGKPITEVDVHEKIKEHVNTSKSTKKTNVSNKKGNSKPKTNASKSKKNTNSSSVNQPVASTSAVHPMAQSRQSESNTLSDSDSDDNEVCCVCNRFYPEELRYCVSLTIVTWGCCDVCNRWVHLKFCTPVRVLRRGDSFLCPTCTVQED